MPWTSKGVTLTDEEVQALDKLAKRHKISRNALMRFFILYGLKQVEEGKLNLRDYLRSVRKLGRP